MKTYTGYTAVVDLVNKTTLIHFHGYRECTCGIKYTTWGKTDKTECEEGEVDLGLVGYWFTCPICRSTQLLPTKEDV